MKIHLLMPYSNIRDKKGKKKEKKRDFV